MQADNFDNYAVNYRKIHSENVKISGVGSDYFSEYKVLEVKKRLNNRIVSRILDLGCGDGNSSLFFNKHFPCSLIYGIDVSAESIDVAKNRNLSNCFFCLYDGRDIPFENDFFDVVFISCVLHHLPAHLHCKIIEECKRTLKKDGLIYIFEHNPYNPVTRKIVNDCIFDRDAVLLTPRYARRLLFEECFRGIKTRYTVFIPRFSILMPFVFLENYLYSVPIGGQYYISGVKR